ncbi:hypothetical protein EQG68_00930 [Flavobacterium piscinae]|uniref:TonB C-terminal domain-containing protein n=1 Tax=Flavobacterium piscinae TaxID=2506424 RepID=A0A4Q1KYM8_9FLAO|nr:hypothetical protein EQG68_00930 [Flavobacterium piscinae]
MKHFCYFFFIFLLASCQYFEKRVPSEEELLQKRLKEINWNEVTVYPSVAECDSILDKELKKECFFRYLTEVIHQKIAPDSLLTNAKVLDTIEVRITVFPDSKITFEPLFPSDSLTYDKQKTDSIIKARLTDFPKIEPAQKEGIPVKTQFILPVILKAD